MRSLGIDLAAQPQNTAYCAVQWYADMALVETPKRGADDASLLDAMVGADWTGIDAPFGWPEPFTIALGRYLRFADWPADATPDRMRLRETDRFVRDVLQTECGIGLTPLSVPEQGRTTPGVLELDSSLRPTASKPVMRSTGLPYR